MTPSEKIKRLRTLRACMEALDYSLRPEGQGILFWPSVQRAVQAQIDRAYAEAGVPNPDDQMDEFAEGMDLNQVVYGRRLPEVER